MRDDSTIAILGAISFVVVGVFLLDTPTDGGFLLGAGLGTLCVVGVLRYALGSEPGGPSLSDWISVARGSSLALMGGLILIDPTGSWAPAILFGIAAGFDGVDGWVARARDSVSAAGERLDEGMDTLMVLIGTIAVVLLGLAHPVFLVAGIAKFVFQGGQWWRRRQGRSTFPLDESRLRKALSAALLVAIWIALFPVTDVLTARVLTWVALVPFCAHFLRDWLVVTGHR